jgi:two-component system CheB/CheR fusion protein
MMKNATPELRVEAPQVHAPHRATAPDVDVLRASEQRLRIMQDQAPVGIREVDLQGRYLRVNDRYCELTGYSREELLARRVQDITFPDDVPASTEANRRVMTGEVQSYRLEKRYVHKKGQIIWIELHGYVVRDDSGKALCAVGITQDISERKRTEQALLEADQSKNRFLAMLAHELRGPLAPLRNAAQLLKSSGGDLKRVEWVSFMMERQIKTIARMVDDLLDVSRITQGKVHLQTEVVDLCTVIRRTSDLVRPALESRALHFTVELPEVPVTLVADSVRLEQIFANLFHNAIKFTPRGGHIWVTTSWFDSRTRRGEQSSDAASVEVRVRDDGDGMDARTLASAFDLFAQGDQSIERSQGGLGIGLTLVRSLVELHGGTVTASSKGPGQGSEFVVRLPVTQEDGVRSPTPDGHRALDGAGRPRRILVVDDNRDASDTLAMLLRAMNHDVRVAHDGPSAIADAGDFKPQVVLLDIGLPGMDGFEVARRLRDSYERSTVLVAISGYGQDEDRRRARESGFDHYFTKPVGLDVLRDFLGDLAPGSA